jgi:hypothetical protein
MFLARWIYKESAQACGRNWDASDIGIRKPYEAFPSLLSHILNQPLFKQEDASRTMKVILKVATGSSSLESDSAMKCKMVAT